MNRDDLDLVLFDAEHRVFDTQNAIEFLQVRRLMGLPAFIRAQVTMYHLRRTLIKNRISEFHQDEPVFTGGTNEKNIIDIRYSERCCLRFISVIRRSQSFRIS